LDPAGPQPAPAAAPEPGLLEQAGLLWAELRGLARDQFELAALELRAACSRFALMVALALAAAALAATAWLGLVAAAVFWFVERGASPVWALLATAAVNLAVAAGCVALLRHEGKEMPFAATFRSLFER
jgi:uncharacterized membrane protein YqjE